MTMPDLDAHWQLLLTTALLGTERREPPPPVDGVIGDVVADAVAADPARRLLLDVAVTTAVRRAAFLPGKPVPQLAPPADDPRPVCPAPAVTTWRRLRDVWPVLEDEWIVTLLANGWRLPADATVALLVASRRDACRRQRVHAAAGPVAHWLLEHVPGLAAAKGSTSSMIHPEELLVLPELPISPEVAALLPLDAHSFVERLLPGFEEGRVGAAHRPVLVNLLARCRPDVLTPTAAALAGVDPSSASAGIAAALTDLVRTRAQMLDELSPPPHPTPGRGGGRPST